MTKEELLKRESELIEIVKKEDERLQSLFEKIIQNTVNFDVVVRLFRHAYHREICLEVGVPYENRNMDFSVYFKERKEWDRERKEEVLMPDNKMMGINYGTYGTHTSYDRNGKFKQYDILIGKVWELEDGITDLYNSIDWTNEEELLNVTADLNKIKREENQKVYEEETRKKQEKINNVIDSFHIGMVIYTLWEGFDIKIEKITNDYVYLNIPYAFRSWHSKDKRKRYTKEEFAKELIRRDNL